MGWNNKHIIEESSEGEKLIERLLSYMNDEIKDDDYKNITSNK